MTYPDAIQFLYNLRWFGAKFGLENTLKLAALAGNPQSNLRFIHVAGTNGKGSTCAMLESIYRAAGLRVGLFTSPHLVSFGERMQVNRHPIQENEVVGLVKDMQGLLKTGWGSFGTQAPSPGASLAAELAKPGSPPSAMPLAGPESNGVSHQDHPTFFEVVT